jgi:hypothetical protein
MQQQAGPSHGVLYKKLRSHETFQSGRLGQGNPSNQPVQNCAEALSSQSWLGPFDDNSLFRIQQVPSQPQSYFQISPNLGTLQARCT